MILLPRPLPGRIAPSEITSAEHFAQRRTLMRAAGLGLAAGLLGPATVRPALAGPPEQGTLHPRPSPLSSGETPTPFKDVSTYNNFYEFGLDKDEPARNAGRMPLAPWTLHIEGLVQRPLTLDLDALLKLAPLEERIYRLRCVEGWSMVIPWTGYPLSVLLERAQPLGSARFVQFISHYDETLMLRRRVLEWPYTEGLRLDEARHPLTLLTLGLYGNPLPAQNGAPVRIVVPWKYGFKSAKSIVRLRLLEKQPVSSWEASSPHEYGFYANVNPDVDHPRWSQKRERRIGELGKRPTLPFNGYAEAVASLYAGMDLRKHF